MGIGKEGLIYCSPPHARLAAMLLICVVCLSADISHKRLDDESRMLEPPASQRGPPYNTRIPHDRAWATSLPSLTWHGMGCCIRLLIPCMRWGAAAACDSGPCVRCIVRLSSPARRLESPLPCHGGCPSRATAQRCIRAGRGTTIVLRFERQVGGHSTHRGGCVR